MALCQPYASFLSNIKYSEKVEKYMASFKIIYIIYMNTKM